MVVCLWWNWHNAEAKSDTPLKWCVIFETGKMYCSSLPSKHFRSLAVVDRNDDEENHWLPFQFDVTKSIQINKWTTHWTTFVKLQKLLHHPVRPNDISTEASNGQCNFSLTEKIHLLFNEWKWQKNVIQTFLPRNFNWHYRDQRIIYSNWRQTNLSLTKRTYIKWNRKSSGNSFFIWPRRRKKMGKIQRKKWIDKTHRHLINLSNW